MKDHISEALLPAAPPTAVTSLSLMGIGLDQWVLILNAIYIGLGIVYLLYKIYKGHTNDRK